MHLVVANKFSGRKAMLIQCVCHQCVCARWLTVSQKFCCFSCKFPLLANHVESILVPLLSSWVTMVFLCFSGAFWSSNLCFKGACKKACCIEIGMETNHQDANIMISGKEGRAIAIQGIPGPIRTWAQHLTSSFLPGSSWNLIVIPVSATFLTSELIPWKGFHILR